MTTLDTTIQCTKCAKETKGRLYLNERLQLTDSDGGLVFADGWHCHNCLGEPWTSADVVIEPREATP